MAGGLTQVLSDGTNTYLYGVDRINQQHDNVTELTLTQTQKIFSPYQAFPFHGIHAINIHDLQWKSLGFSSLLGYEIFSCFPDKRSFQQSVISCLFFLISGVILKYDCLK
jgi:hypothetical protein